MLIMRKYLIWLKNSFNLVFKENKAIYTKASILITFLINKASTLNKILLLELVLDCLLSTFQTEGA